jgi:3-oxoacyl-[acyl-carrier-protein] synthase III
MQRFTDEAEARKLVRAIVARELPPEVAIPADADDFVKSGAVDSMGWVGILSGIEDSTGLRNFGSSWPEGRAQSIDALARAVMESANAFAEESAHEHQQSVTRGILPVSLLGWGYALGSHHIEAADVEREYGLPAGTMGQRAGIEAVCRAAGGEDEATLAQSAAALALEAADLSADALDLTVVTSATFLQFPSLASVLHTRLLLRESCAALDVGGACAGLLHVLATAQAFLSSRRGWALVVASEVHSRRLAQAPGEFRGLFGDGACALVLSSSDSAVTGGRGLLLGDFLFGCAGTFASALRLVLNESGGLETQFRGEKLGGAAVNQLARIVNDLEMRSVAERSEVDFFCIHEPNPRLVEIFAQKAKIPLEKVPLVSKACGNLGSATCGVSLCSALDRLEAKGEPSHPPLVFMAAVGPGLLWAGTWLAGGERMQSRSKASTE